MKKIKLLKIYVEAYQRSTSEAVAHYEKMYHENRYDYFERRHHSSVAQLEVLDNILKQIKKL